MPANRSADGEAARRHHEHQPRAGALDVERLRDTRRDVAREDRREIGVDDRGVAAPDQLDQRRALVADRDLGEADRAREPRDLPLVLGIAIGVHEDDRDARRSLAPSRASERGAHGVEIGRLLDRPVGEHALVDLDDVGIELLRLDDVARRKFSAAPGSRSPARRGNRASSPAASARRVRSSRALVATVVPILTKPIGAGGDRRAAAQAEQVADRPARRRRRRRGFPTAACAHAARPCGSRPITSVKVPPRSIQKSQRRRLRARCALCGFADHGSFPRSSRRLVAWRRAASIRSALAGAPPGANGEIDHGICRVSARPA